MTFTETTAVSATTPEPGQGRVHDGVVEVVWPRQRIASFGGAGTPPIAAVG